MCSKEQLRRVTMPRAQGMDGKHDADVSQQIHRGGVARCFGLAVLLQHLGLVQKVRDEDCKAKKTGRSRGCVVTLGTPPREQLFALCDPPPKALDDLVERARKAQRKVKRVEPDTATLLEHMRGYNEWLQVLPTAFRVQGQYVGPHLARKHAICQIARWQRQNGPLNQQQRCRDQDSAGQVSQFTSRGFLGKAKWEDLELFSPDRGEHLPIKRTRTSSMPAWMTPARVSGLAQVDVLFLSMWACLCREACTQAATQFPGQDLLELVAAEPNMVKEMAREHQQTRNVAAHPWVLLREVLKRCSSEKSEQAQSLCQAALAGDPTRLASQKSVPESLCGSSEWAAEPPPASAMEDAPPHKRVRLSSKTASPGVL